MAARAGHGKRAPALADGRATRMIPRNGTFRGRRLLKRLIGSGDRIGLFTLPFFLARLLLNIAYPSIFDAGGPPTVAGLGAAG